MCPIYGAMTGTKYLEPGIVRKEGPTQEMFPEVKNQTMILGRDNQSIKSTKKRETDNQKCPNCFSALCSLA
jgi:hypothetical protein